MLCAMGLFPLTGASLFGRVKTRHGGARPGAAVSGRVRLGKARHGKYVIKLSFRFNPTRRDMER